MHEILKGESESCRGIVISFRRFLLEDTGRRSISIPQARTILYFRVALRRKVEHGGTLEMLRFARNPGQVKRKCPVASGSSFSVVSLAQFSLRESSPRQLAVPVHPPSQRHPRVLQPRSPHRRRRLRVKSPRPEPHSTLPRRATRWQHWSGCISPIART